MRERPEPDDTASNENDRSLLIEQTLLAHLQKRSEGEDVEDAQLEAQYPELMPELSDRLGLLREIADQRAANEELETVTSNSNPPRSAPETIGRYRILGTIGKSGQATVYRGLHPTLDKEVAIKLCRPLPKNAWHRRQHLVDEGKILGRLEHANIAKIYDLDFYEDRPFLVLQYVRGCNLRQYAQSNRLSAKQSARMLVQAAAALSAAHEIGIVHRDLKPDNILVDHDGKPWIIDFGVALLRDAWSENDCIESDVTGTVGFMPPEQARGEAENIDPRSDVFGIGAVLYWCLTGKPPFTGLAWRDALQQSMRCEFDAEALQRSGAPRSLQAICLKAMSAEPNDRYASAAQMARQLESFGNRTRRHVTGLVVGLLFLATVFAVPKLSEWLNLNRQPVKAFEQARLNLDVTVGINSESSQNLVNTGHVITGQTVKVEWDVPLEYESTLFWFGASGTLFQLTGQAISTESKRRRFVYPEPGYGDPVSGPGGTELIFVCARRDTSPLDVEIRELCESLGPWPALPSMRTLEITRDGLLWQGLRDPTHQRVKQVEVKVEERAEKLRRELADRYELFRAVAFSLTP